MTCRSQVHPDPGPADAADVVRFARVRRADRRRPADDQDPFLVAQDAYYACFEEEAPLILAVPPDRYPALIAAMNAAIKRGERLSQAEVLHLSELRAPAAMDDADGSVF